MIEFWSYRRELRKHKKEIHLNIKRTLNSGQIFFGKEINKLEKNFIKKYKSKYYKIFTFYCFYFNYFIFFIIIQHNIVVGYIDLQIRLIKPAS